MAIELQDNSDFGMTAAVQAADDLCNRSYGVYCRSLAVGIASIVLATASGWSPPTWLQPSLVGMLWASLFLMGAAAGSIHRGSAVYACVAGGYLWLCQVALQALTSLFACECGLLVTVAFFAGWLTSQLDFSSQLPSSSIDVRRYRQWTIWDIALLTTLVAVVCYAVPRLESSLTLLSQVGFVLGGGCLCSWVAYRWVFDDCWTIGKLSTLLVGSGLCFWLLARQTPTEHSLLPISAWMLTGPLAVIAAQGLCVLTVFASIRLDRGSLMKAAHNADDLERAEPSEGLRIYSA